MKRSARATYQRGACTEPSAPGLTTQQRMSPPQSRHVGAGAGFLLECSLLEYSLQAAVYSRPKPGLQQQPRGSSNGANKSAEQGRTNSAATCLKLQHQTTCVRQTRGQTKRERVGEKTTANLFANNNLRQTERAADKARTNRTQQAASC